jgi:hypothetical protein
LALKIRHDIGPMMIAETTVGESLCIIKTSRLDYREHSCWRLLDGRLDWE